MSRENFVWISFNLITFNCVKGLLLTIDLHDLDPVEYGGVFFFQLRSLERIFTSKEFRLLATHRYPNREIGPRAVMHKLLNLLPRALSKNATAAAPLKVCSL